MRQNAHILWGSLVAHAGTTGFTRGLNACLGLEELRVEVVFHPPARWGCWGTVSLPSEVEGLGDRFTPQRGGGAGGPRDREVRERPASPPVSVSVWSRRESAGLQSITTSHAAEGGHVVSWCHRDGMSASRSPSGSRGPSSRSSALHQANGRHSVPARSSPSLPGSEGPKRDLRTPCLRVSLPEAWREV